jgi:hypothetical protein
LGVKTLNFIENSKTNPAAGQPAGKRIAGRVRLSGTNGQEISRLNRRSPAASPLPGLPGEIPKSDWQIVQVELRGKTRQPIAYFGGAP